MNLKLLFFYFVEYVINFTCCIGSQQPDAGSSVHYPIRPSGGCRAGQVKI